ncbi:microfibril-associated glycoprotein 4-like [Clupea harengus]|uniref:Microfibril-associated glycoprotein 4-like n=1 Tax=Clupea harengus TaxID=7950 RepID=A0A6P8F477_CLUHA|nr:microfibril-associated glycoprotein 4-like [Clupea harengus]
MYWIQCVVVLLLPWLGQCSLQYPTDCADLLSSGSRVSGVYTIYPDGVRTGVQVYCHMGCQETIGEGGWTVFQKRVDGTVNFFRPWNQYKDGFGNASSEYWLGLESLHQLTTNRKYELKVDMEDFEGNRVFARYSSFAVGSEIEGYKLTVSGLTNGGAGDSLYHHRGQKFSTFDKDQDFWETGNCAIKHLGAYWYGHCRESNPNGLYLWSPLVAHDAGVVWNTFKGIDYSLKSITMKIRPVA